MRPRPCGRPPRAFLPAPARRPFQPVPCPCGAVRVPVPSPDADPHAPPPRSPHAARLDPLSHPVSRLPTLPDTDPARGTSRFALHRPSWPSRPPPADEPPVSTVEGRHQARWPGRPPATAPALPRRPQPHVIHALQKNSPAAATAPLSGPYTLVRIEIRLSVSSHLPSSMPPIPILSRRQLV